jgi:RNA polymerase sigma factor (sigma-70 family)
MASYELDEAGLNDQPIFSADEDMSPIELSTLPGVSDANRTQTLVDDFENESFGEEEPDDDPFEIPYQPGAPVDEQDLVVNGVRTAVEIDSDDLDLLDIETAELDTEIEVKQTEPIQPMASVTFNNEFMQAAYPGEDGDLGHVDARVTYRGKYRELVIDDMTILSSHLDTDIPERMLAAVAETSKRQGIRTVDSKVTSVRGLNARINVFGPNALSFHDPESVHGDVDQKITIEQAARYLEPGDRLIPLHVRAALMNRPYAQLDMDPGMIAPSEVPEQVRAYVEPANGSETVNDTEAPDDVPAETNNDAELPEELRDYTPPDNTIAEDGTILNDASFSNFVDEQYSPIQKFVGRQFGLSTEAAEDLTQSIFMKAWANRASFDGVNPRGWIYTIAWNTGRSSYAAEMVRPKLVDNVEFLDTVYRNAESGLAQPEAAVFSTEDSVELMRMFEDAGLSMQWRQIMVMRVGLGMPYKEISERLKIPIGTVLSSTHRAMKKLRAHAATNELVE